jgi:hypothetical protein
MAVLSQSWRPLPCIAQDRLREARLQAHYAVQWLARAARPFVPPEPGDHHTSLGWDDALDGLVTHPLTTDVRLGLNVADLTLELQDPEGEREFYALDGRTDAEVRHWLGGMLAADGLDAAELDAPAPYTMPEHALAGGGAYGARDLTDALVGLAAWFANAHGSLAGVNDRMIGRGLVPSPVRCWPHHFDIATLTLLESGDAERARSVNTGLSPGDEHYDEPYFYVSPYPYPDPAKLPALPPLGHWHVRGITAAIALASRIIESRDRQAAAEAFLDAAVAAAIAALS